MKITVKLFAVVKEIVGTDQCSLDLPDNANASEVIETLSRQYPKFADWKLYVRIAVNREYVPNDYPLSTGDEVAIIPPVSGG